MRIAIVGAGPAGSTAALQLARQGRHEVILLDRDNFPRTKTCGSGLSPGCLTVLGELGLTDVMHRRAYPIRGARFAGPSGREATLSGSREGTWIVSRAWFDAELAWAAERAGARFEQGFKAIQPLRDPSGRYRGISDGKREIEADLVLFADGAHSRFSEDKREKRQIATIMGWWRGVEFLPNHVEMWFAPRVAPWYGWLFPEGEDRVNIGICYDPEDRADPKQILAEVIERHVGRRMRGAEQVACECSTVVKYRGAPIVYTDDVGPVAAPGALWIGESARLTNAATGEGIFHAMKSAQIAAEAIGRNLNGSLGATYERQLRRQFGTRLRLALAFLRFVPTPAFNYLTQVAAFPPVGKALNWAVNQVL